MTIKADDISIKKKVFVTGIADFFIVVFRVTVYLENRSTKFLLVLWFYFRQYGD
jgi:hypothetical protein